MASCGINSAPFGAMIGGQKCAVSGSITKSPSAILKIAAPTASRMTSRQDRGRTNPSAAQPPSRSRVETSAKRTRIGTSLGRTWNRLWPITAHAAQATSAALITRALQRRSVVDGRHGRLPEVQ